MKTIISECIKPKFTPLSLFAFSLGIMVGSLVMVKRDYQDSWILEGLVPQFLFLLACYCYLVFNLKSSSNIAIVSSIFLVTIKLIPALKYDYPYGTAIDQGFHLANLQSIITTGIPLANNVYSEEPGIILLMASLNIWNSLDASTIIRLGPPILFSVTPILLYAIGILLKLPDQITKYIPVASVVAYDPYLHTFTGSTTGAMLFAIILLALIGQSLEEGKHKLFWTTILIGGIFSLIVTHVISSVFVFLMIFVLGFFEHIRRKNFRIPDQLSKNNAFISIAILGTVATFTWWMFRAELVFDVMLSNTLSLFEMTANPIKPTIPLKFIELSLHEKMIIVSLNNMDFLVTAGLSLIGVIIILLNKKLSHDQISKIFVPINLLILSLLVIQFIFKIGQVEYTRLLTYFGITAPFLMSFVFSEGEKQIKKIRLNLRLSLSGILFVLLSIAFIQAFPYQPAVPIRPVSDDYNIREPIVYVHFVASLQERKMLDFFQSKYVGAERTYADIVTHNIARGYWGGDRITEYRFSRIPQTVSPLDLKWNYFLSHQTGPSGPLFEQVEKRLFSVIDLEDLPDEIQSVPYNNGGSFIMTR